MAADGCTATRYPKRCLERSEAKHMAKRSGLHYYLCDSCGTYHVSKMGKPKEPEAQPND